MTTKELSLKNYAMTTDFYLSISGEIAEDVENSIVFCQEQTKTFESQFSRFLSDSELSVFNEGVGQIKVSDDLFRMILLGQEYYKKTNGLFDLCVLPVLLKEGYQKSKDEGFVALDAQDVGPTKHTILDLEIDSANCVITKPKTLKIDLGGIGKGYLVDKLSKYLASKYSDFCFSLGGDLYAHGRDVKQDYDYWAIDIENPNGDPAEMPLLMVKDTAVATSGVNKRTWKLNGETKTHLIDMRTHKSAANELASVTVLAQSAVEADVYAKTLLILGLAQGLEFAKNHQIDSVFVDKSSRIYFGWEANKYVWKD